MESENNKAQTASDTRERLLAAYREHLLLKGEEPRSVYAFCHNLGIEEAEFYQHFNSFEQIADAYWRDLLDGVIHALKADAEYAQYEAREKMLAFYYAFFAELKQHRSFALLQFQSPLKKFPPERSSYQAMKKSYQDWVQGVIREGMQGGEVASRASFSGSYDTLFWWQLLWLINFWKKDRSQGFEKTDAAIEKSVRLSFDLIEKNALDSAFDFGKFMFQNR